MASWCLRCVHPDASSDSLLYNNWLVVGACGGVPLLQKPPQGCLQHGRGFIKMRRQVRLQIGSHLLAALALPALPIPSLPDVPTVAIPSCPLD